MSLQWDQLGEIAVNTLVGYVAVVLLLRLLGARSTAKMNNFDWVVTVALGSCLASLILLEDLSLAEGLLAIGLLLALQYTFNRLTFRYPRLRPLLLNQPRLLYYDGSYLEGEMRRSRVTRDELHEKARGGGFTRMEEVLAVVLESNGELSVLGLDTGRPAVLLAGVEGCPEEIEQAVTR